MLRENGLKSLVDERRLTRTADTCYYNELAKWELGIYMLEVIARTATEYKALTRTFTSFAKLNLRSSVKVLSGKSVGLKQLIWRSLEYNLATFSAGTWTDINNVVGTTHHVFIVLNHDNCVAKVAQLLQRTDKSLVVALMKSDRWLVENIEYVYKLRTNLSGQTDTLTLTT